MDFLDALAALGMCATAIVLEIRWRQDKERRK